MPESTREAPRELSDERIDAFVRDGFVAIRGAVDPDFCEAHVRLGLQRLGAREDDPETWSPRRIHMPVSQGFPLREHAPRAWEALCQLLGGAERVREPAVFCDNFTVVWPGEGPPWRPPEEERGGWHVDGDWFLHFLDSPEQAILGIVLWRDIEPGQGGTYFAPDSIGPVARFLVAHPEGLEPEGFDFDALRGECRDLREITGRAGDFFWMHPFMLHSASINGRDRPRILSNNVASLREPMRFDRPDECYSPLERGVLHALGVPHVAFQATRERRRLHPEREKEWERLREEEKRRLGRAGEPA